MSVTIQTRARPFVILGVLFSGAFVMGCAEMLVVGLLDLLARDLRIEVSAAGALVTANALGLALGGPVLTFLTTRWDRRTVLWCAASVFVLANVAILVADHPTLVVLRFVAGAMQGLFIAAAMVTATAIVPAERTGRAMAVVISGFATASALGLPLGTILGQSIGWRGSFVAVVLAAVAVLVLLIAVIPRVPSDPGIRRLGQARHAFSPRVLAVLSVSTVTFAAMLSAITYLVPFLDEVSGVSGPIVSVYLLAYGIATTAGSALGGRFADANAARMLVIGAAGVLASLGIMLLFGRSGVAVAVAVVGIGAFGMATAPSIQHRVVAFAGPGAPLAASLPASAVNVGIAGGAAAGGAAIDLHGVAAAVMAGMALAVGAVIVAAATSRLREPAD